MNRKIAMAAAAALSLTATAGSAVAQGGHRSFHDGWGRGDVGFGFGVGFSDGYYGSYRPSVGVSFDAGYDDWSGGRSFAATPNYGCTCPGPTYYRSSSYYTPRYRSANYARIAYPTYGYSYDPTYDSGSYASVGFGWSDDGWRGRRWRGDYDGVYRTSNRSDPLVNTRVSYNNRGDREFRQENRINDRTSGSNMRVGATAGYREGFNNRMEGSEFRSGTRMKAGASANARMGGRSATVGAGGSRNDGVRGHGGLRKGEVQ